MFTKFSKSHSLLKYTTCKTEITSSLFKAFKDNTLIFSPYMPLKNSHVLFTSSSHKHMNNLDNRNTFMKNNYRYVKTL